MKITKLKRIASSRIFILVIVIVVVSAYSYLAIAAGKSKTINGRTGGEKSNVGGEAFLSRDNKPYSPTGDIVAEHFLRQDLAYFARSYYKNYYPNPELVVEFKVTNIKNEANGLVTITGRFTLSKDNITITSKSLNYNRLKTSIKLSKTGTNIDSELPSNNTRNQLIGTLPLVKNGYTIDYLSSIDKFAINIYDDSIVTQAEALQTLTTALKFYKLTTKDYFITTSGGSGDANTP